MKKLICLSMAALVVLAGVSCKKANNGDAGNDPGIVTPDPSGETIVVPEAVDLGIVVDGKTIKWGSFNLGATKPEEYGDYYAWGETEPKDDYSWSTYKFGTSASGPFSKYNTEDDKTVLESGPEGDDVASKLLGGKWRMPTDAEWTALRTQCTWTAQDGINGRLVTATNGNSIFLPFAGFRDATGLSSAGSYGSYWSSSLNTDGPYRAWGVNFDSDYVGSYHYPRYSGFSVRPVCEE